MSFLKVTLFSQSAFCYDVRVRMSLLILGGSYVLIEPLSWWFGLYLRREDEVTSGEY